MLDSDVELFWVEKFPEAKFNPGCRDYALSMLVGMAAGATVGKELLDFGPILTGVSGLVGLVLPARVLSGIEDRSEEKRNRLHIAARAEADRQAEAAGNPKIRFTYRSHEIKQSVLPEHLEGNIYTFKTNDEILLKPRFAYQPKRNRLEFEFFTPAFPYVSEGLKSSILLRHEGAVPKGAREYATAAKKLVNGSGFNLEVDVQEYEVRTELAVTREINRQLLIDFTRKASDLMQLACDHRQQYQ